MDFVKSPSHLDLAERARPRGLQQENEYQQKWKPGTTRSKVPCINEPFALMHFLKLKLSFHSKYLSDSSDLKSMF